MNIQGLQIHAEADCRVKYILKENRDFNTDTLNVSTETNVLHEWNMPAKRTQFPRCQNSMKEKP
jgi:hypothetical protein